MKRAVPIAVCALLLAGCGGRTAQPAAKAGRDRTVWLCRPGIAPDPCLGAQTTTIVGPGSRRRVERIRLPRNPPVDCFYVYPTISAQRTVNASLVAGLREQEVAVAQASRFSSVCKVYAPVYRQITLAALAHPARITLANAQLAYASVLGAFRDYLARYNDGRGIVFIGHSQGAAILIRLLQREVDDNPALRRRLVSALLLGGDVTNRDFDRIAPCRTRRQTGCVVAYSSFATRPPQNSQFGRTTSDLGVRLLAPHTSSAHLSILCVNPAAPGGGTALLEPALPSLALGFLRGRFPAVSTPWVAFRGSFTGRCETAGNATWLQVSPLRGAPPLLAALQEPVLGLHVLDVNIALDDLVALVHDEASAYRAR